MASTTPREPSELELIAGVDEAVRLGTAGCLIPPFEYHTLANALSDRPTITLHVYGGEMDFCNLYRPTDQGWWHQVPRSLEYAN